MMEKASNGTGIGKKKRLFGEVEVPSGEGNRIGPDLTHLGSRLHPEYLFAFLRDPDAIIPGVPMKKIDLWEEEATAIARFLTTLQ